MPQTDHVTASRLTDCRVQTYGNAYLGYVEDIVVDPAAGVVTHAIVHAEANGPLGHHRRVLVPWGDFVKAYNEQVLTLDASSEQWQAYPDAPFDLVHRGLWAGAPRAQGASGSFVLMGDRD